MITDEGEPRHGEADGAEEERTLLTEQEAADLMRCSKQKIKRLRLAGKLAYYPGRPPMIELKDLKKLSVRPVAAPVVEPVPAAPKDKMATAEEWARWTWFKLRHGPQHRR